MKIVVSGATGLIGTALTSVLTARGHEVVPLIRRPVRSDERAISWDPEQARIDRAGLEGCDAVIHLAGENVFGRMSPAKKHRIRDSRVLGTRLVADALAGLARRPSVLLAASAVGYYGDRGDETLDERSATGSDFLAQVAREWEAATAAASRAGIRVVNMRFGIVMTPNGGALAKMLPAFRLGLGGPIGSGKQYVSWIALPDLVEAIGYLLDDTGLDGPVNLTSPTPVTNREFAKTLGKVLGRPAAVSVPAFALRMAFGVEGAAMMQSGQRVLPRRLQATAFHFAYPAVEPALRHLLAASEHGR